MNDKESKKSSFFIIKDFSFKDLCYIIFICITLFIAVSNYCYIRREGYINIFVPSRYGIMRGPNRTSDRILLCFTIHNNGNIFRNIKIINLTLINENGSKWNLKAIGKFDNLKDLDLREDRLFKGPNLNYSLVTHISLNKNQFVPLNLLFYYEDDTGGTNGGKVFSFKGEAYIGKITVTSLESDDNGYRSVQYESDSFNFTVKYKPYGEEYISDTFTDINIGEKIK